MIGATAPFLIEISRQKAYHISMQKKVRKAIKRYGLSSDLISKILDIKGKVKGFNKTIDHSKRKLILNDSIKEGSRDVVFAILVLVYHLSIDIDEALDRVFDKYAKRFLAKRTISYEEV